ncbi:MAG: tetratricopeptide repeat protein, partial [Planctomycetota bacterium]
VLGQLHLMQSEYALAVEQFESAIIIEPDNWALADDEVETLVEQERLGEAIHRLRELIDYQGPFPDLHVRLADLHSRMGHEEQAQRHYHHALELDPGYLEAMVKLGTHHMLHGRWEEAAEHFYQACQTNDRVLLNYVGAGVAQWELGQREDAMNSFDLAAAVEPNSTLLLAETARLHLKSSLADGLSRDLPRGRGEVPALDARSLLARQLARHADEIAHGTADAEVRYRYGVLLRQAGQLGAAAEQFRIACEQHPADTLAVVKLAITQSEMGKVPQAVETFRRAFDVSAETLAEHYRLSIDFTDRDRFRQAMEEMQADSGESDPAALRRRVSLSLQEMGLLDRAAATWRSLCHMHHAGA